ncbi:WEB family protein At1g12150 [Mercurialis annua]|uniref:WEB family protein At1g12150 n=1 Tax=Mercurialis annua TaxID=3986 RepID=UPI00215E8E99|nr:WEB family protein At1g12150 [Mercurialis annua]XP_050205381.1 WEB family protein At1g12150 [Mercurialis annua]
MQQLRMAATEEERDLIFNKSDETISGNQTEAMLNGKVADVFSELKSAMESLSKSNEELRIKELVIESLESELEKAKELETKLAEKDELLEKLKEELLNAQSSEARACDFFSKSKERIHELESEIGMAKEAESEIIASLAAQTKQLEQTKMLLEESKLEKLDESSPTKKSNDGYESEILDSEFNLVQGNSEIEMLKNELKQAIEAEENSKKAMDDLALALKEVATESNQTKNDLIVKHEELENLRKESEELKEKFRNSDINQRTLLEEAIKEADLHRNIADRLRLEADESIQAWNGKETGFVECIRIAEEEKLAAMEENKKLLETIKSAEKKNEIAKQENQKLRDILKQALNEANVAKEAARIAISENSQLKDSLAEKDDALIFITRENENLRINEVSALENIKELKKLASEATSEDHHHKEQEHKLLLKSQNSVDKEAPLKERKLSNAFSFNLKELLISTIHSYTHDPEQKIQEKHKEKKEDNEEEESDPLKGSIFDVTDSPVAAATIHHHRRRSSTFAEEADSINADDLDHIDGVHIDDVENEKNPKKKKALLRRFGDIIIRRRGVHRRESSVGTSPVGGDKKESSEIPFSGEIHKKDSSVSD